MNWFFSSSLFYISSLPNHHFDKLISLNNTPSLCTYCTSLRPIYILLIPENPFAVCGFSKWNEWLSIIFKFCLHGLKVETTQDSVSCMVVLFGLNISDLNMVCIGWIYRDFDTPCLLLIILVDSRSYFFAAKNLAWHMKLEHHITINLDLNIEDDWFITFVFVNYKMRQACRLGKWFWCVDGAIFF